GDAALAEDDLVDAARRDACRASKRVLADTHRHQELFQQHFAGMDVGEALHGRLRSVVVDDPDVVRIAIMPAKAHAPLVVDPDAVPAPEVALQSLQAVRRRNPQVLQTRGVVEHAQLPPGDPLDRPRQTPRGDAGPNPFRFPVGEIPDHGNYNDPRYITQA